MSLFSSVPINDRFEYNNSIYIKLSDDSAYIEASGGVNPFEADTEVVYPIGV